MSALETRREGHVLHVVLNRPEVKNAFDESLIAAITEAFEGIRDSDPVRVVCLRGEGPHFCAGGDLGWMRRASGWSRKENRADALRLFRMLLAVRDCPKPVVAAVRGFALGGGSGLAAACDRVIAEQVAVFGFTEVRLGIIPGAISPFVIERIGPAHARDLFTSGRRFNALKGLQIGLVSEAVPFERFKEDLEDALGEYRGGAPQAVVQAKRLAFDVSNALSRRPFKSLGPVVAARIAAKRADAEAREGFAAFFAKRPPSWVSDA